LKKKHKNKSNYKFNKSINIYIKIIHDQLVDILCNILEFQKTNIYINANKFLNGLL